MRIAFDIDGTLTAVPEKLKKVFEKEYRSKGLSTKEADRIFYGYENKLKKQRR